MWSLCQSAIGFDVVSSFVMNEYFSKADSVENPKWNVQVINVDMTCQVDGVVLILISERVSLS